MKCFSQDTEVWTVVGMDLIGPLCETPHNNRYNLTMTDLYTKWFAAAPLTSKTTCEVAAALVKIMYTFGLVRKIITDQGKEFVNKVRCSCAFIVKNHSFFDIIIVVFYKTHYP